MEFGGHLDSRPKFDGGWKANDADPIVDGGCAPTNGDFNDHVVVFAQVCPIKRAKNHRVLYCFGASPKDRLTQKEFLQTGKR